VFAGLLLLSAVPMVAGTVRLVELGSGAGVTPENARFMAVPLPVVLHIVSACVYCVLGAWQFVPAFRRRRPRWHRVAGWILIPAGIVAALSGLWMTLFYPYGPGAGPLLSTFRLVFGVGMAMSIVLAVLAVRRRDIRRHSAWMIRGYAIGQGAGTQVLTNMPWMLLVGVPNEFTYAMLMAAGWVVNLAVAEWVIRRRVNPGGRRGTGAGWPRRSRRRRPADGG
jgi:uncharacterized membrane protein